jgi:tetratricopeptide (TPR) repeat protein
MAATLIGCALIWLGLLSLASGDLERAQEHCTQGLHAAHAAGDLWFASIALNFLAQGAWARGDRVTARALFQQALPLAEALHDSYGISATVVLLGDLAQDAGNAEAARDYYAQALTALRDAGFVAHSAEALAGLAALAIKAGEPTRALRLASATVALATAAGGALTPPVQSQVDRVRTAAEHVLSLDAQVAAWVGGQTLALEQAIDEALSPGKVSMR